LAHAQQEYSSAILETPSRRSTDPVNYSMPVRGESVYLLRDVPGCREYDELVSYPDGKGVTVSDSCNSLTEIETALAGAGLVVLGAFHPRPEDAVPAFSEQLCTATIVLAGNGGGSMWPFFQSSAHSAEHPLNAWSAEIFQHLAKQFGAQALSPADGPPFHPFQRWALRSGQTHTSPIGILIHPKYGLWHSYRGALLFAECLELPAVDEAPSPCHSCIDRPCLTACPVGAFQTDFYDVERCTGHVSSTKTNDCRMTGCRARHACPVGRENAYSPAQAQFHMAAFLARNGGRH
jgi:hypothetical protein